MRQQHMLISQRRVSAGSAWRQVQPEQPSAQGSSRYGFIPQHQPQEQFVVPPALPDGTAEQREESSTPGFGPGSAGSQWLQAVNIAALTEAQMREQQQHKESGPQLTQAMWTDAPAQAMVRMLAAVVLHSLRLCQTRCRPVSQSRVTRGWSNACCYQLLLRLSGLCALHWQTEPQAGKRSQLIHHVVDHLVHLLMMTQLPRWYKI